MAMAGRDGGYSSCTISSSTGTISTTYASTTGSSLSSIILDLEIHDGEYVSREESEEGQMMKHIASLVQEFFGAPLLANCSGGGDMRVLERWFSDLGVGWVLHLPLADDDDAPAAAGKLKLDARSWIRALAEIVRTIRSTASLFPEGGSMSMGLPIISEEGQAVADDQFLLRRVTNKLFRRVTNKLFRTNSVSLPRGCEEEPEARHIPDQLQFAQFFQQAMLKMLAFVDSVVGTQVVATNGVQEEPYEKLLSTLLGVRGALSKALVQIQWPSNSPASPDVLRIQRDIVSLLAAKEGKTGEAIWSTMQQVLKLRMEDLLETQAPPESSGIHKATRSVTRYMGFLRANYSSVAPIVSEAARYGEYAPQNGGIPPLDSMFLEMASSLEEKLGRISRSFPNNSLGLLFLINNMYYMMDNSYYRVLTCKIKKTIEYYLQVSWAPVLLCLDISHTPFRLGRYCSPLPKFDSEFLKTYEVQKFWKVPNPDLREVLRRAVTEKVVSGLTEYLRDSNTTCTVRTLGSSFTPQELEEMLQELYEG